MWLSNRDRWVEWKTFYVSVFALVIPMALQNLINVGVSAADVAMLGNVSESVLSGASLAGQVQFIMSLVLFGITSGITILTAQYWGKKDVDSIEKIMGIGIALGLILSVVFTILAQFFSCQIMRIYTSEAEVIVEGVKYLRIVSFTYIFMALTQIYLFVMRSMERVVIATFVYSISLVVNVIVNAILIFGYLGFPALGIQGAAIGTLIARILELVIVVVYAQKYNRVVKVRMQYIVRWEKDFMKDIIKYASPVILHQLLWGLGFSMHSVIIGHLGSEAVAANAVVQVIRQFAMVVVYGISTAAAVYLGKTIGEGKMELTKLYAKRFVIVSSLSGVFAAGCILLVGPLVKSYMTLGSQAIEYLEMMLVIVAIYAICNSIACTLIVGVFRSGGDTKFAMIMDSLIMWGITVPLGAAAAFVFHLGVPVVYACLMADEFIKIPIVAKRFLTYKWLNNITRSTKK